MGDQEEHQRGAKAAAEGDDGPAGQVDSTRDDDDGGAQCKNPQHGRLPQYILGTGPRIVPVGVLAIQKSCDRDNHQNGQDQPSLITPQ